MCHPYPEKEKNLLKPAEPVVLTPFSDPNCSSRSSGWFEAGLF
jgi:hypothetical protein